MIGFEPADILIPKDCDLNKWCVVACDQYTSEPEYWEEIESSVKGSPSALNLILPEVYLEREDIQSRIENINRTMDSYLEEGLFAEYERSFVYVERTLDNGLVRKGMVGAVDLEAYDYTPGARSLVRPTEGTILSRIPPRVRIRENAALELPHIMLLIDDPEDLLFSQMEKGEELYDTPLMGRGGHVRGYLVNGGAADKISNQLKAMQLQASKKCQMPEDQVLLYAVGDGNHSLATAKAYYEQLKKSRPGEDLRNHPARYALAELVNIHGASLDFEPIHRVVFDVDTNKLLSRLKSAKPENGGCPLEYVCGEDRGIVVLEGAAGVPPVDALQRVLDGFLEDYGGRIDYIHGEDVVDALCQGENTLGIKLPPMGKSQLFETISKGGALPRKTFSMGHAWDKRYYLECRRIK